MRAGALCFLALLVLVTAGFAPFGPAQEPFAEGNVMVAGSGIRIYSPGGHIVDALALGSGPNAVKARSAAVGPDERVYFADDTPVLRFYEAQGGPAAIGEYPDGFVITALDATGAHVYAATSDGGFLNEIWRVTLAGVHQFPYAVESPVTALDTASDDCTIFYATQKRGIRRADVCTYAPSSVVANIAARDLALLPDSTLLVVPRKGAIVRLAPDGRVLRRYKAKGVTSWRSVSAAPDASTFWAATPRGVLYRFTLASGAAKRRFRTISPLVALDVVGAPAGTAPPPAPPKQEGSLELDGVPTLTGEGLFAIANPPATPPQQCTAPNPATMHFSVPGQSVATGPYPGEFSAEQTASIGPQTITHRSGILGVDVGRVQHLDGSFDIRASDGRRVQGSLTLPGNSGNANTGACLVFQNQKFPSSVLFPPTLALSGYFLDLQGRRLGYRASIQSGGRTYFDQGDTALFTDDYYLTLAETGVFAGAVNRIAQSFHSRLESVEDTLDSKSDRARHVVVVRGKRKSLTLRIHWPRARDAFRLSAIGLTRQSPRALAGSTKLKPGKLKPGGIRVRTTRNGTTLRVVVTKLKPGTLRFAIAPLKLSGATTVVSSVENPSPS